MADKLRQIVQRLKDKVHLPHIANGRDNILTKYVTPPTKVSEIADKFKYDSVSKNLREIVSRYEKFTGVEEIMAIQKTVVDAQDKFMAAQDRRRELGRQLADVEMRLKELHSEMQNTMKGDDKYLHLCTDEHKLIVQERALRALFGDAEREERELFATMSAAVKLGHERERAHAERNKYWYIVASILGTVLGIAGSSINNHLKMSEFRQMMEQQMARSASVLYTIAGGGASTRADITEAMKAEFAYQDNLANNLKEMQENINNLVATQESLIEHLHHREKTVDSQLRDLTRAIITASQSSQKSDAEITKVLSAVHHDLEDADQIKELDKNKVLLEPNQILTGIGIIMAVAVLLGNIIGRVS